MNVSAKQHQDGIGAMTDDGIGAALAATRRWRVEAGGIQVKVTLLDVLTERVFLSVSGRVPGDGVQEKKFIIIVLCFVDINNSQVTLTEFKKDNLRSACDEMKDNHNNIWQQIKNLCHRKRLPRNFPSQEWRPPHVIQYHIHWSLGES